MVERHRKDGFGRVLDGVDTTATFRSDLSLYDVGRDLLARFSVPTMLHRGAPNERLFMANFDGTGNDADGDPEHRTNVHAIHRDAASSGDPRVQSRYLRGPGTQEKTLFRGLDGGLGYSHDRRVREMYDMVVDQARKWMVENPASDIRVVITGFSRGAEQAASLARMVHERGLAYEDANGRHQLTPPGKIPQSVMLFDPVGTGVPHVYDRRLASSVISGVQIVARDERRSQFPSSTLIRQGMSDDGRFLGITVPGAHSDVGGSYHMDGLPRASLALGVDFLNAQVEDPFLQRPDLRENIWEYDGHKSEQHSFIYTTGAEDRLGERDTRGAERFPTHCRPVEECAPPDPADESLIARLGPAHPVSVGQTPLDLIGREIAMEQAPEDQPRLPSDIEETRALISKRELAPDASWADHFQETRNGLRAPATQIEFSREPGPESEPAMPLPTSPAHPTHRDHHLYNSIHGQLTTVHKEEGITLSPQQMDRLAHCSVATAKQCGMSDVSHLSLGQDKQGNLLPEVHLYQAFRGDVDDPRTKWGKLDALEAFQTPVETASRDLQVANQQMDQVQQDQQMRMAQQQEQGMSMSR